MKIKVRTSLTSTIEVLREEVELSNTRAYCFRYAHSQHAESHLGKKLPQAKIPIAFLFSKLHFNNVTEMLSFYSGHLLIRSSTPNFLIVMAYFIAAKQIINTKLNRKDQQVKRKQPRMGKEPSNPLSF